MPAGFADPAIGHDQAASNTIGLHVGGDAPNVRSARRFTDARAKLAQADVRDFGGKQVHRRVNKSLTVEDRPVEGVLDAVHAAGHVEIDVDTPAGRNPAPPRHMAPMPNWKLQSAPI